MILTQSIEISIHPTKPKKKKKSKTDVKFLELYRNLL